MLTLIITMDRAGIVCLATQTEYLHLYWGSYVNGTVLTIKGEYFPNRITS